MVKKNMPRKEAYQINRQRVRHYMDDFYLQVKSNKKKRHIRYFRNERYLLE